VLVGPDLLLVARAGPARGQLQPIVDRERMFKRENVAAGDVLLGLRSNGLHTNGYTLARRVLLDVMHCSLESQVVGGDTAIGDALLAVHRSYAAAIRPALALVHGLAHITGGGIAGNLVRVLPDGCQGIIDPASWQWPALCTMIADGGHVSREEMRNVFNLGVGMIAAVPPAAVDQVRAIATAAGVGTWACGEVRAGTRGVQFAD
jgi:phosphoribosylformylglycinamidine cyclo-ligase